MAVKEGEELIRTRIGAVQKILMDSYKGAGKGLDSYSKGIEREAFVQNFPQSFFPPHFRFGSGVIVARSGRTSSQVDIVIEQPFAPSFPIGAGSPRVFIADSVGIIIEIKSDLGKEISEDESRERNGKTKPLAKQVARLCSVKRHAEIEGLNEGPKTIPTYLVSYESRLGQDRLAKWAKATRAKNPALRGILIIKTGLFIHFDKEFEQSQKVHLVGGQEGADGFLTFIASIHFELQRVSRSKVNLFEYFGLSNAPI